MIEEGCPGMPIHNYILLSLISISVIYLIAATICTDFFFGNNPSAPTVPDADLPPVSVIKPVCGLAAEDMENFVSFCRQDYPEYELLFALSDDSDPAISLLERLKDRYPDRLIRWVIAKDNRGPNYKVGNLIAATRMARYDVFVYSDSDIRVGPGYLKTVVTPLINQGVGLVTCLYRYAPAAGLFSILEALSVQTDFIPNVLFDYCRGGFSYAFGSTLSTHKQAISRIDGLESLVEYLADDYQMGNRISRAGLGIILSPYLPDHRVRSTSPEEYFRHRLRTAVTHRVCRPGGFGASIITHTATLGLIFLILNNFNMISVEILSGICGLRILSTLFLDRRIFKNSPIMGYCWLVPFNDILNTLFWFLSFFVTVLHWKHRRFRIFSSGKMVEIEKS